MKRSNSNIKSLKQWFIMSSFSLTMYCCGFFFAVIPPVSSQTNLSETTTITTTTTKPSSTSTTTSNVANQKPAKQLKTFGGDQFGRLAGYAVDGSFDTTNLDRCACTDDNTAFNWWQVDLMNEYAVTAVTIYAPTASSGQLEYYNVRFSNIYVGNDSSEANVLSQPVCASIGADGVNSGGHQTFNCNPQLVGRYVTIRKTTRGQMLTICEVEINVFIANFSSLSTSTTTAAAAAATTTTIAITDRSSVCVSSDQTTATVVGVVLGCALLASLVLHLILFMRRRSSGMSNQSASSQSSSSQVKGFTQKLSSKSSDQKVQRPVVESAYADVGAEPGSSYAQLSERPTGDMHTYTTLQQTSAALESIS